MASRRTDVIIVSLATILASQGRSARVSTRSLLAEAALTLRPPRLAPKTKAAQKPGDLHVVQHARERLELRAARARAKAVPPSAMQTLAACSPAYFGTLPSERSTTWIPSRFWRILSRYPSFAAGVPLKTRSFFRVLRGRN